MTTAQTEAPKYPVGIPYRQLRQPPDLSAVTAIDPKATAIIQLSCTEAQFATSATATSAITCSWKTTSRSRTAGTSASDTRTPWPGKTFAAPRSGA